MIAPDKLRSWQTALPFWLSFLLVPLLVVSALFGGWLILLPPLATWYLFAALDGVFGLNTENADPMTPD
ncbi:MAG: alkane 1-monooxygenase, partial [Phaeobacter italicus]